RAAPAHERLVRSAVLAARRRDPTTHVDSRVGAAAESLVDHVVVSWAGVLGANRETIATLRRRTRSYVASATSVSALAHAVVSASASSSAWFAPCPRVGGMACAASPTSTTR